MLTNSISKSRTFKRGVKCYTTQLGERSSIAYRRPTVLGYPKVVYCMNISKLSCREFTKVNPDSSRIAYTKVLVGNIPTGTIHHQHG